ncbi:Mgat4a [Phodopus roborovskii]|uniref:Mgat4a protein n=1 Tax=Phodopus roborovskii TaxID=109678 RepID=A0AAV0A3Y4_PHORO|nr:Mgat4a [Phodopus roborovskii]
MGIPTVKRQVKSYLMETLHSLIDNLYPEEKLDYFLKKLVLACWK